MQLCINRTSYVQLLLDMGVVDAGMCLRSFPVVHCGRVPLVLPTRSGERLYHKHGEFGHSHVDDVTACNHAAWIMMFEQAHHKTDA